MIRPGIKGSEEKNVDKKEYKKKKKNQTPENIMY